MKTTRKLLVLCLVLVMGMVAIMPSTFSWYSHSAKQAGDRMNYTRKDLPVSSGTIKMETKKYYMQDEHRDGNGDENSVYYDTKGNKEYNGGAITSGSVAAGKSQYYGTTFTNTGTAPAYVNLYLSNFTNGASYYIGTTAPSLTHKGISSSVHLANNRVVRVYFQWDKAGSRWTSSYATRYVVCNTPNGKKVISISTSNVLKNKSALKNVDTYYVDLEKDTTSFYFATNGKTSSSEASGINTTDGSVTSSWYRTKTITDIQAEKGYYLTGETDDTTWNAAYTTFDISGGLSVMKQFDNATMNAGQKAYVTLTEGIHFTGASATYKVQSGSNITVNENTGLITTGSGFGSESSAVIRTTIKSSLGDTKTIDTTITNPKNLSAATVSMNIEIPGKTTETDDDGNTVTTNGKAEVVWYVRNEGSSACTFDSIYYTK